MSEQRPAEGRGGDAKALAEALCKAICDLLGEPRILVPGEVLALLSRPPVGDLLAATLAAQPAAPQPTEGGALTEVDRLHSGLHQCRGGRFYDDDDPEYRGTSATRGPCPTAAAARAGLAARSQPPEGVTVTEVKFSSEQLARLGHWLSECLDDAAPLNERVWRSRAEWMVKGPTFQAVMCEVVAAARSQRPEGEVCACGYGTVCQACKLADRLDAQRTEGVTLMTEPHDGHAANETCPGCPHAAEVSGDTEAGGDRG